MPKCEKTVLQGREQSTTLHSMMNLPRTNSSQTTVITALFLQANEGEVSLAGTKSAVALCLSQHSDGG